jgi:hypothetical protein
LHNFVVVVDVAVVVVEVVQLLHSTGQSLQVAAPNSACEHCDASVALHTSGSGDPLQESVVVVVVVAVIVVVVVVDVAVLDVVVEVCEIVVTVADVVVVLPVVVVVVSTHVSQRTVHCSLYSVPMPPVMLQYLEPETAHSSGSGVPLQSMVVVAVVGRMQLVHSTGQSVRVTPPNSGCTH